MPLRVSEITPKANGIDSIQTCRPKAKSELCHSSPVYKTKNQAPKWLAMVLEKDNNWIKHIDNGKIK